MKTIDCKGLLCPMPLIETKKAIKLSKYQDILCIEVDNESACKNVTHFLNDHSINVEELRKENVILLKFMVPENFEANKPLQNYCEVNLKTKINSNSIILLNSNSLGVGNEDLGKILMKGFINTISELEELPSEIICYNSAVTLATKGSDTSISLKKLESLGVKITLCGTCVDFYGLKDSLDTGTISNMFYIASKITSVDKIIKP